MANTVIQLKYSTANAIPTTLNTGEPAYSYVSGNLFIGNATANGVILIGGKYYTDIINAATNANTGDTLVKRDASGNFSAGTITAALTGNASTASKWQNARTIGVSGDATGTVSIDGSANANIPLTLANSGVTAGTYGGPTTVPVFSVDSKGRVTGVTNTAIALSSSLSIAGDTGTDNVTVGTNTLTFEGGDGITTTVSDNKVSVAVDNTVVRTSGSQSITGDLSVSGNLVILGNTVTQDVETIRTEDTLIELGANNSGDLLDIGFFGTYNSNNYTAFFRDANDSGKFKLLVGGTEKPNVANTINTSTYSTGTLVTNITGGTVSGLTSVISVSDGGTGQNTFTSGQRVVFDGTKLVSQANVGTVTVTGGLAAGNTITSISFNSYGEVTAYTGATIAIGTGQITSGTLGVDRGGTGIASYTVGDLIYASGETTLSKLADVATGNVLISGGVTTAPSWGKVGLTTHVSGTLAVGNGGTGTTSLTANAVVIGQGTAAVTTVGSSTEGHILTINASGVPQFMYLSGGTF